MQPLLERPLVHRAVLTARYRPSWQGVAVFVGFLAVAALLVVAGIALTSTSGLPANAVAGLTILIGAVSTLAAVASVVVSYLAWRHPHG